MLCGSTVTASNLVRSSSELLSESVIPDYYAQAAEAYMSGPRIPL